MLLKLKLSHGFCFQFSLSPFKYFGAYAWQRWLQSGLICLKRSLVSMRSLLKASRGVSVRGRMKC